MYNTISLLQNKAMDAKASSIKVPTRLRSLRWFRSPFRTPIWYGYLQKKPVKLHLINNYSVDASLEGKFHIIKTGHTLLLKLIFKRDRT